MEDVRNLAPQPLLATDRFESIHSIFKPIRKAKRTSINPLYTMMSHYERLNVYNSTSQMKPDEIEKTIKSECHDKLSSDYIKKNEVQGGKLYECTKMSVYNTAYRVDQFVILPGSKNTNILLAKIHKCVFKV